MKKRISDNIDVSEKRLEGESWEDYKERRRKIKALIKRQLAGFNVWSPSLPIGNTGKVAGPYVKEKHGEVSINNYLEDINFEGVDSQEEE